MPNMFSTSTLLLTASNSQQTLTDNHTTNNSHIATPFSPSASPELVAEQTCTNDSISEEVVAEQTCTNDSIKILSNIIIIFSAWGLWSIWHYRW